jgi:outer membrane protein OmpA-like peptidoglycan-associated protein
MSGRRVPGRLAAGLATLALSALPALSGHAASSAAASADGSRPTAASREMDRAQALLQLHLASLPEDSGVLVLRDPEHLILRIPARLLFEPDSPSLKHDPSAAAPLAASLRLLKKYRRLQVQIVVYTDSIGEVSANQNLSDQRALAVYGALGVAGIARNRLQQHGAGAATMVAGNDTPQGRIENRRIEIEFGRAGLPPD